MAARPPLYYHRAALSHVAQLAVLALALATALVTLSVVFAAIALVLAEALLVAIVPRLSLFRASVDRSLSRAARESAEVAHMALLADMRETHASELALLERLAAAVRASWVGESSEVVVDRALGIDGFLATYARLAVAYRRSADAFATEGWVALEAEAARLANLPHADSDEWLRQRRAVVDMRRAAWMRASRDRDVMLHTLATIGELVRFVHDLSATSVDDPARADLDDVLGQCAEALARVRRLEADVPIDGVHLEASPHVPVGPRQGPERPLPPRVPEPRSLPVPQAPRPAPSPPPPPPDGIPLRLAVGGHAF